MTTVLQNDTRWTQSAAVFSGVEKYTEIKAHIYSRFSLHNELVVKEFYDPLNERITEKMLRFTSVTAGVELATAVPTCGLPYVDSPTPMFAALAAYLVGVCGGSLWIKIDGLKPRTVEPNWLRILVFLHNAFCLVLIVYMCSGIVAQSVLLK